MAVYREAPRCIHCGKVIAKAKTDSRPWQSGIFFGDNFVGWEYIKHDCKKKSKMTKEEKEEQERLLSAIKEKNSK